MAAKKGKGRAKANRLVAVRGSILQAPAPAAAVEVPVGGVEGVHGEIRRKPGPKADPAKRGLRKYLLKLYPDQAEALRQVAIERLASGKSRRLDSGEVLRLVLKKWIEDGCEVL